ncbi:hypothetical protein ACP70R_003268 [Stipagrostis hirtigluma subsp. patula]
MASLEGPMATTASICAPETARGRHLFEIRGYSLHKGLGSGKFIQSTTFAVGGHGWCTRYLPDGDFGEDCRDYVSVFLALMTKKNAEARGLKLRVDFDLKLVNLVTGVSKLIFSNKPVLYSCDKPSWGSKKFMKRSTLEASPYLQDNRLLIECDVTVVMATPVSPSEAMFEIQVPPSNLSDDLGKLLEAEKRADVTFKVQGEVFHAHKLVLACDRLSSRQSFMAQ